MNLSLYRINDDETVINKKIENGFNIDIRLKSDVDIIYPSIKLMKFDGDNFENYNYAHIEELNRYYFINNIRSINNRIVELTFTCDVLETYKEDILNSKARFKRTIKNGDFIEGDIDYSMETTSTIYPSNTTVFSNQKTIILTTIGA